MTKPKVKICGITNLMDALFCAGVGANALGFIFYEKSRRFIEPSRAASIIRQLPPTITPVGVFVNSKRAAIERVLSTTGIRVIQLSGDELPAECEGFPTDVWKTFRIRNRDQIETIRRYRISVAILDGANDDEYGGSGTLPEFSIAREMKKLHPLVLAGGLNPENVVKAIRKVRPYAIDVNSGVELLPGKKDHEKVKSLFDQLRHAQS